LLPCFYTVHRPGLRPRLTIRRRTRDDWSPHEFRLVDQHGVNQSQHISNKILGSRGNYINLRGLAVLPHPQGSMLNKRQALPDPDEQVFSSSITLRMLLDGLSLDYVSAPCVFLEYRHIVYTHSLLGWMNFLLEKKNHRPDKP